MAEGGMGTTLADDRSPRCAYSAASICADRSALPCLHAICSQCVKKHGRDGSCPLCKTALITDPVDGLPPTTNRSTGNVDYSVVLDDDAVDGLPRRARVAGASIFGSDVVDSIVRRSPFCERHAERTTEIFCFPCNRTLCIICYADDDGHTGHLCTALDDDALSSAMRAEVKRYVRTMQDVARVYDTMLTTVDTIRQNYRLKAANVRDDVDDRAREVAANVAAETAQMRRTLDAFAARRIRDLDRLALSMARSIELLDDIKKRSDTLIDQYPVDEVSFKFRQLNVAVHVARAQHVSLLEEERSGSFDKVEIQFSGVDRVAASRIIGRIVEDQTVTG